MASRTIEEPQGNLCLCIYRGFIAVMRDLAGDVMF